MPATARLAAYGDAGGLMGVAAELGGAVRRRHVEARLNHVWSTDFLEGLSSKREVALRMGEQITQNARFVLRPEPAKDFFSGRRQIAGIVRGLLGELQTERAV